MAKISLRAYNREIESLIERGQTEEAVAHCKFILKTYPKHLDTYRLLGKAYLESQRYSEAADILRRILSVQPNDFVAQIGMSIIREDEGNLDAAIYHMERAFEVQPANAAIQDELRRLYGRRDGLEPSKLRLTHGGLVRMYAHGDLYRQAIAEARATLKEDPQRLDLEIVLAKMYYLTGQKAEAAEICSRLITKLPFCLEANQILAEVLPETSRAKEAKNYQQKLVTLNPYYAYINETNPNPQQVPDQTVVLERLEWTPSLETEHQPAWADSLGIQIAGAEEEKAPDWLVSIPSEKEAANLAKRIEPIFSENPDLFETPAAPPPQETLQPAQEAEIPDWMRSAGWGVNEHPGEEQPVPFEEEPEPEADIAAPANLPDWLREMAPAEPATPSEDEQKKLEWLASILPGETAPAQKAEPVSPPAQPAAAPAGDTDLSDWFSTPTAPSSETHSAPQEEAMPDWLKPSPGADQAPAVPAQGLPDWLSDVSASGQTPAAQSAPAPKKDDFADWLNETPATPPTPTPLPAEAVEAAFPNWLSGAAPASEPHTPPAPSAEADLDWLNGFQEPAAASQPPAPLKSTPPPSTPVSPTLPQAPAPGAEMDLSNFDQAMAWLENLAAKQGAEEETLLTRPDERIETQPDWVTQASAVEKPGEAQVGSPAPAAEESPLEPAFEWSEPVPATEEKALETAFDWTESAPATEDQALKSTIDWAPTEPAAEESFSAALPEWEPQAPLAEEKAAPQAQASTPPEAEAGGTSAVEMDDAFSWLETLAARQGAQADSLLVAPDERQESAPQWVQQHVPEPAPAPEPPATVTAPPTPAEPAFVPPPPTIVEPRSQETLRPQAAEPEFEVGAALPVVPLPGDEAIFQKEEGISIPLTAATALPAQEKSQPAAPAAPSTPAASAGQDMDDAFSWLESLAAKQGAETGSLLLDAADRQETPPDWVQQHAGEPALPEAAAAISVPAQSTLEPELPDLEDLFKQIEPVIPILEEQPPVKTAPPAPQLPVAPQEILPTPPAVTPAPQEIKPVEPPAPPAPPSELETKPSAAGGASTQTDMDDAFAWLESLAAKQGAEADSLLVAPSERQETPPEWVQQQPAEPALPEIPAPQVVTAEPVAQPPAPVPAPPVAESPAPIAELAQPLEAGLPDWLQGLDTDTSEEAPLEIPPVVVKAPEPAPVQKAPPVAPVAAPDWVHEVEQEKKPEPPPPPAKKEPPAEKPPVERRRLSRDFGHTRPLPSWLSSSTPPAAPEKPAPAPEPAAIEESPLPDWLREGGSASAAPAAEPAATSDEGLTLPDWLKNIGTEEGEEPLPVTPVLAPIEPPLPALEVSEDPVKMLQQAQLELTRGHVDRALAIYDRLIQSEQHVEETIHDLRDALYRYPVEISIWQMLGDAYIRDNRIQDALDSYTKAEELLK